MVDYEQTFEDFWKDIVVNPDGTLNIDQVKRELSDYKMVMDIASEVYCHVTGGIISKPNTLAKEIIAVSEDRVNKICTQYHNDECAGCDIANGD